MSNNIESKIRPTANKGNSQIKLIDFPAKQCSTPTFNRNPEITMQIDDLDSTATEANGLVRGLLQAFISLGLEAEMDAHLGHTKGDREGKAVPGSDNYRNGSYLKRLI
ncbi:transposase [Corynebacterium stationis]|uniref:transposase n=1 Tax=Corynebacterium stationis TaxID=1705 RepID=UPI0026359513|nr:hypothetical protein [Corynebacterium stationis]